MADTESKDFVAIDPEVSASLVADLQKDFGRGAPVHTKVVAETGKFLYVCATSAGEIYRPSLLVDYGWHAFILRTRAYAEHCDKLGRFVHHNQDDEPMEARAISAQVIRTYEAIKDLGLRPDEEVWGMEHWNARCSACHPGIYSD